MKSPAFPIRWLVIPLAAAAGFYTSRQSRNPEAAVPSGQGNVPAAEVARGASAPAAPGSVRSWAERLRKLQAADLPAVYAEIDGMPSAAAGSGEQEAALRLLCARWAELDPAGGVAFLTQAMDAGRDPDGGIPGRRAWLLTEWALLDPAAAYEAVLLLPERGREYALTEVGSALLREDQDKFLAWFQKARLPLPEGWNRDAGWAELADAHFDALAAIARELAAAEPWNKDEPRNSSKLEGMYAVLGAALARKDVDQAVAWAKEQPEQVRNKALAGALEVVAKRTPERVAEFLPLLKSKQIASGFFHGSGAEEILQTAVNTMGARDPLKTLEWLNGNVGKLGDDTYGAAAGLADQFAKAMKDGRLTAEQAFTAVRAAKGDDTLRLNLALSMWRGLPADQLAAAAEWLKGADSQGTREWALQGLFPEWIKQDKAAALAFAESLEDKNLAATMFQSVARGAQSGLVSTRGERVAATLREAPPEYRADMLTQQVRMLYGEHSMDHNPPFPGETMAEVLEGLPSSASLDKATAAVAQAWGMVDPHAALTWAAGQADPGLREKAVGAAVEAWAKEDAMGASEWTDAQPPGEQRDTAAHHLARVLRTAEPESAWTWAASIGDPATRLEAQSAVLRKWRDSSAAEAQAAVDAIANTLPPADHQRLVDTLQRRDSAK